MKEEKRRRERKREEKVLFVNDDAWDNNTENDYWDADASGAVSTDDVRLTPVGDAVALSTTETTIASASITPTRNASLIVSFGTTPAEVSTGETVNITAYNDSTSLTPAYPQHMSTSQTMLIMKRGKQSRSIQELLLVEQIQLYLLMAQQTIVM